MAPRLYQLTQLTHTSCSRRGKCFSKLTPNQLPNQESCITGSMMLMSQARTYYGSVWHGWASTPLHTDLWIHEHKRLLYYPTEHRKIIWFPHQHFRRCEGISPAVACTVISSGGLVTALPGAVTMLPIHHGKLLYAVADWTKFSSSRPMTNKIDFIFPTCHL